MVHFEEKPVYDMDDLVKLLRILRAPGGCPWDREQTHLSNRRNFLEEAYEAAEAFDRDDPEMMCEELGDMLMQVLFNIHIEEDAGRFTTDDVTDHIVRKLIYRHPHVFGTAEVESTDEVLANWEQLKRAEKGQKSAAETLDAVARSLPALWRADKLQSKAEKAGFRFRDADGSLDKLEEEVRELREAVENDANIEEELGDVLFAAVNAGRYRGVDPEDALNAACEKFIRRFRAVEDAAAAQGKTTNELENEELAALWRQAKQGEKQHET
ncbi:MAG: nucleoside triphosphate pyrophosphohydrolase [Ruminococcaceae bacterium]|jgi:tetrapyrrole methylase family protein/MazG family protein|nr:nucleoside triphosphate pyrophosphohydrolase [Oscillospiraceae bacterium]